MKDLEIILENKPGQLALMGETLGIHGISLEGGGVFDNGPQAVGHFLVEDAGKAKTELEKVGIPVRGIHEVIVLKLRQDIPGQLGAFCRELGNANINILTQYSDHSNQLILVVDRYHEGKEIARQWMEKWWNNQDR